MTREPDPKSIVRVCGRLIDRIKVLLSSDANAKEIDAALIAFCGGDPIDYIHSGPIPEKKRAIVAEYLDKIDHYKERRVSNVHFIHDALKLLALAAMEWGQPCPAPVFEFVNCPNEQALQRAHAFVLYINQIALQKSGRVSWPVDLAEHDRKILDAVSTTSFALKNSDIADRVELSERTVAPRVKWLVENGLLFYAKGKRSGVRPTEKTIRLIKAERRIAS